MGCGVNGFGKLVGVIVGLWLAVGVTEAYADYASLVINGKAIHFESPPGVDYNESNWGLGIQYDYTPTENNVVTFLSAGGFQDSFRKPSYYAGGGVLRRFAPIAAWRDLHVDAGLVGFLMTRHDRNDGRPFPGILPNIAVGTRRYSIHVTYVPKVDPKTTALVFFQLRIPLSQDAGEGGVNR